MTIMFDRVVSVGGWLHSVDERDIGTEFPLRSMDFEQGVSTMLTIKRLYPHTTVVQYYRQPTRFGYEGCLPSTPPCLHRLISALPEGRHVIRTCY
jgi:hypothetical protein